MHHAKEVTENKLSELFQSISKAYFEPIQTSTMKLFFKLFLRKCLIIDVLLGSKHTLCIGKAQNGLNHPPRNMLNQTSQIRRYEDISITFADIGLSENMVCLIFSSIYVKSQNNFLGCIDGILHMQRRTQISLSHVRQGVLSKLFFLRKQVTAESRKNK